MTERNEKHGRQEEDTDARIGKDLERKRENARDMENMTKKENRERDSPRRGDERRIGYSHLEGERGHEKGI